MHILFSRSSHVVTRVLRRSRRPTYGPVVAALARYMAHYIATDRSYVRALKLLETTASNHAVTTMVGRSAQEMNAAAIPEMLDWLGKAGYTPEDLKTLKAIHVAGTKGKGSVSAMVAAILKQYKDELPLIGGLSASENHGGIQLLSQNVNRLINHPRIPDFESPEVKSSEVYPPQHQTSSSLRPPEPLGDIGMYTSPHLITVRERISVNGNPISQEDFAASFFRLWDRFTNAAITADHHDPQSPATRPNFFRYLTIMAFDVFLQKGIRTAVIECGIGGEFDSTNVLPAEAVSVTAITRLGIDHVAMLGDTVESIAWHKSGIFKPGVPAFSVGQSQVGMATLKTRAKQAGCSLKFIGRKRGAGSRKVRVGLEGDFQRTNARLAISVAGEHLRNMGYGELVKNEAWPKVFDTALEEVSWQGRCEIRQERNISWFIDGAHNDDSLLVAAKWFAKRTAGQRKPMMLIFNQQIRDGVPLLTKLHHSLKRLLKQDQIFQHGIFCSNTVYSPTGRPTTLGEALELPCQTEMEGVFSELEPNSTNIVAGSIEEAVEHARSVAEQDGELQVLVTGSLHLVGGLLQILNGYREGDTTYK